MSDTDARQAVVAEALTWLRTPYAHRQQVKGVGVDCAQFPLAVYAAVGVIPPTEIGAYCPQWHLHRGEELYLDAVRRLAREIAPDTAGLADFAVWRYGRTFSHGAILLAGAHVVHALRGVGVTLGDRSIDEDLRTRPMRVFSLWPV
ncbi:MAG: C40 family peptidase [Caulobacteraceae bacterium]